MRRLLLALLGCGLLFAHGTGFAANGYCDSNSRNTFYFWQQSVTVGEVEITSGVNGGYNYVPDSGITLQPGTNTIDLTPAYRYYNYTVYWRGWLDLNGDNQFTSDEQLFETSSRGPISVTAELPDTFEVQSTTLRIAMKYGSYPAACEIYYYGETEDLVVQLPQVEPEPEVTMPALEDTYHLTLDSDFTVSRDGAIGDDVGWVIEKNGTQVLNRNAGSELEYRYYNNTQGADFRIWLNQFIDGEYQRVSNIVEYTPGTTNLFELQLSEGLQINRSGELGVSGNLTWVIEMDGNIVFERLASNELEYVYYRNWAGTKFRVWLKQVVDGQYKVVSNTVEYQTNQTEFTLTLDQKYKLTRNGQPGDQVRWIVEENGLIIEDRDASNEMSYTFVNAQPGSRYLIWLQMNIGGQEQVVSNVVSYDEPTNYDYTLNLGPDYQLTRSGNLGEPLTWVIVKDGNMALQRSADNELSFTYFSNTGSYIEAYLHKAVGGYYQRVSNVVRYEVKDFGYTISVASDLTLVHNGNPGEPLVWVIEQDGVQVLQRDASQEDDFLYPGNTPGSSYRAWLGMVVDGTFRPVSNVVTYQVPEPLALDITLNSDFSISRSGVVGDPVSWVVEENNTVVWSGDASNVLTLQYSNHIPGAQYRVWLEALDTGEKVSNQVEYVYSESDPQFPFAVILLSDYTVQRDGYMGDPLGWVIEENGIIVRVEDASENFSYQYPNHVTGAEYSIWLEDLYTGEPMSNRVTYTYSATEFDYTLSLNEDYTVTRSGSMGDPVWWRVEENGNPIFQIPADSELTLQQQSAYTFDQVYTVRLMDIDMTVDLAEPVRFTYVEPGGQLAISIATDGTLTRNGYEGDPVWWVVEEDGVVVHEATALESLTYTYPDLKAGSTYRFWLVDYVTSQKRVVSNLVTFTPGTDSGYEYQITLSGDGRIFRSGELGDYVDWVVLESGQPVMWFNASDDLAFNYQEMLPVGSFQVYLEYYGAGEPYQASNMVDVTVP
ncbi:MAG: hypothetical protein KAH34_08840 [Ketobacter sp.]|nr:hypothetical protein [Ketobacter sp.]